MLLKDSGDIKEALFCLSQAVILDRRNKTLYNQRAVLYEQVQPLHYMSKCVVCTYACIVLLQKGSIESAIEDYQRMVEIDPNDSSAILKMGMHHFNKMYTCATH